MDAVKIGLFGIGLNTYWPQFEGLREKLLFYQGEIRKKMEEKEIQVVDAGMVDSPEKALFAAGLLKQEGVEICFLFISTYALSSTVLPLAQQLAVPIILLNIQPTAAIDYRNLDSMEDRGKMTGEWLSYCQACSLPEISSVFNRAGIIYDVVSGFLQDKDTWDEIFSWIDAARVLHGMRRNRLGVLGHYYCGMLDVYTDMTMQSIVFGNHIELLEMSELEAYRTVVTNDELESKLEEFSRTFVISEDCEQTELERAAKTSVALDKLVEVHRLGSLAYYYEGYAGDTSENIVTSVIAGNTLLTGKGIPVAGECEIKNVQAMKIMSILGAGGSFSEFYAVDYNDDIVMLGHDGPAHFAISEGKVSLVPLPVYHGKPGKGLSIQMSVKQGDVTLLSVCEGRDGLFLLVAEGESVPGPTLKIGNTNSRYRFPVGARRFMNEWSKAGPSHHCAIGIGHIANRLRKIALLLKISFVEIK